MCSVKSNYPETCLGPCQTILMELLWKYGERLKAVNYTVWKLSVFGVFLVRIFPHSDWMLRYSVNMWENTDQRNSKYGQFSHRTIFRKVFIIDRKQDLKYCYNLQNKYENFWTHFRAMFPEAFSGPYQTSKIERFAEIINGFNHWLFCKTLRFKCLPGFWIPLWSHFITFQYSATISFYCIGCSQLIYTFIKKEYRPVGNDKFLKYSTTL